MIGIKAYDHIVLRVRDLERMLSFYTDVLGCEITIRRPTLGLVHLRAGHAMLDLIPFDGALGKAGGAAPGAEGRNVDHFCFQVEPFDQVAIIAHLKANGATLGEIRPRYGADGMGVSIYVHDPEGNTVELKGPGDGKLPTNL